MARRLRADRLVIASHNEGKVREIAALVAPHGVAVVSAGDLELVEPVEDGATFIANAALKARAAAVATGLPALADDSGLVVPALDGAPGIHSARWGGEVRDFAAAMAKVHDALGNDADRAAWFACVLALAWPDGQTETFEGRADGHLVWPPRGTRGFGYDAMFVPTGHTKTFGEMAPAAKHAMSHRAAAFEKLVDGCFAAP